MASSRITRAGSFTQGRRWAGTRAQARTAPRSHEMVSHAKDRERWLTHIKQVKDEVEVDRASVDPNSCEIFTPPDAPLELAKSEGGDPVFQLATARVAPSAGGLEPEPELP